MLKLSKQLYLTEASAEYIDYYERSLYNHILSSQHPTRGGFVYFTPMRPRHYRVYSKPEDAFWCCVGSGLENHGKYGELIYAHKDKNLFVNLFIPSTLDWKERGVSVTQRTNFPYEEATTLKLALKKPQKFALNIRRPGWVKEGGLQVMVNSKEVKAITVPGSAYVTIARKWKQGDVVTVSLPMQTKAEFLPDSSGWVSFVHGPIVLAAITDKTDLEGLVADGTRMGHIANGPLYSIEEAPVLVSSNKDVASGLKPVTGKPLTFTAASLIASEKYKNIELVPFFQVHDARYMVYWPVSTPEKMEARKQALREEERAKMVLEASTVDRVVPGEQQPESDHNYKGEQTESGVFRDRHWRHASRWFSYDLRNKNQEGRKLRVAYYGLDKDRTFDIYVNEKLLKTVKLDGSKGDEFFHVDYELPEAVVKNSPNNILTVKFVAQKGSVAGGIYDVRLLK